MSIFLKQMIKCLSDTIIMESTMACVCAHLCPTLCDPMNYKLPVSSVHGIISARKLNEVLFPPPGDLLEPGIKPTSFATPAEPPWKPDLYGVSLRK